MISDKYEVEQSEMTLRPQFGAVSWHAGLTFTMSALFLWLAYSMHKAGLYTKLSLAVYALFLLMALGTGVVFGYLLFVMFSKRAQLRFVSGGIVDQLSPFAFGPIAREDVRKIQVIPHIIFGTALIIDLNAKGPAIVRMGAIQNFCFHVYALFFDGTIYFPLKWLGVTKHDLESRLMLYRQKVVTEPAGGQTSESREGAEATAQMTSSDTAGIKQKSHAQTQAMTSNKAYNGSETPPSIEDSEKLLLQKKVDQIKQHVAQTHLDLLVCELYTDEIGLWLEWEGHRDWPKPKSLRDIRMIENTTNYQEISFEYNEKSYHFGLRRNVGTSQEALLSVSYEGSLCMALRVQVEIGSLTPKRLEQYMQGVWEQELRALSDGIADLRGRRRTGELDEDEPVTQTDVDIENTAEMKRRFGI